VLLAWHLDVKIALERNDFERQDEEDEQQKDNVDHRRHLQPVLTLVCATGRLDSHRMLLSPSVRKSHGELFPVYRDSTPEIRAKFVQDANLCVAQLSIGPQLLCVFLERCLLVS
jgi:hypothetical protein